MTRLLISGVARIVSIRAWGLFASMALAWLLAGGTAFAQPAADTVAGSQPSNAAQNSVKLTTVLIALPAGAPWLSYHVDTLLCIYNPVSRVWSGERQAQQVSLYTVPFKAELERAGYKTVSAEDNLFDHEAGAADYQVAAVITDAHIEGCVSHGEYFTENGSVRGTGSMKIDWQIYSPIRRQVVARVSTSGTTKLEKSVVGGLQRLLVDAFGANARELASNADFRAAVTASKPLAADDLVSPGEQAKIALAGSLKATTHPISDAVGGIVTILTGTGSGSGILVSADGYLLTNVHVVGDEKSVRVRWSDGIETVADVVRLAKARDIALIKTNPRDREPLAIKRGAVTPGQRVYAIGSPKGKEFQGTVSGGIVSANRVIDGLRYIQSDTAISPGSSGGAATG